MLPRSAEQTVDLPVALTVAGSDSGGGAGIQADLKTFEARDAFWTSAITAVTAQNTTGVSASQTLDPDIIREQIRSVVEDFPVGAAKTGMLANAEIVDAVASEFERLAERPAGGQMPLVVDPVMVAESGDPLLESDAIDTLRTTLVPLATVVTPNADEATLLTDHSVQHATDAERAGRELVDMGATAALVTGGHLDGDPADVLIHREAAGQPEGATVTTFEHERIETDATHGSGCTLSAALTAELAAGSPLQDAVEAAIEFVTATIQFGYDLGAGPAPVHHLAPVWTQADIGATCRAVERAAVELSSPAFAPLVPEVGMNVAAAPRYARSPDDVVAVDGRLHRTTTGVRATGGVMPGASSHVARFLLGIRDTDPRVAAACNVRYSDEVGAVVRREWNVVEIDRRTEPEAVSGTMDWAAREVMRGRDRAPDAVLDDGAVGKEAMVRVLAGSVDELVEKLRGLRSSLELDADVVHAVVVDGEVDEERGE